MQCAKKDSWIFQRLDASTKKMSFFCFFEVEVVRGNPLLKSSLEFCLHAYMAHDIKPRKLLNFHKIIQSWVGNEDKNADIESIKK